MLSILPVNHHVPFSGSVSVIPSSDSFGGSIMTPPPPPVRGEQVLPRTVSTAHEASINPKPHSSFHLSETLGSEAEPFCSLELRSMSLTSIGLRLESACSISATTPDTNGVAIDVPSLDSYPLSASGLGEPGNDVPVAAEAEYIPLPYAVKSGFNSSQSSSSLSLRRGPELE